MSGGPDAPLQVQDFPLDYRLRMLWAYPVISGMNRAQFYTSTQEQKDAAFQRILDNRHLQVTHRLYLQDPAQRP